MTRISLGMTPLNMTPLGIMLLLGAAPHTAAWSASESEDAILYSRWQCNAHDGSVYQNGVVIDASVACDWGLTGNLQLWWGR